MISGDFTDGLFGRAAVKMKVIVISDIHLHYFTKKLVRLVAFIRLKTL